MKKAVLILFLFILGQQVFAQLRFIERYEVTSDLNDPLFEMIDSESGLVSFRTLPEKGLNLRRVFQYFVVDSSLNSADGLIEFPVKEGYDMLGYDTDKNHLFILFTKGYAMNSEKYLLQVDLETKKGLESVVDNVLNMELVEFLVQDQKAIFMGTSDSRPVLQIHDLVTKSVHTLQGIYGNDTQILQIRKKPETKSLEVVLSRKGAYRNRDLIINSYDMLGNVIQEVKVDQFADQGQEIMDGILLSTGSYQEAMIGAFGLDRRNTYQGMYIMDINEFGEFDFKLYTLKDFPNFYNYLNEKSKGKRDNEIQKELDREKIPGINSLYSIRDVRQTPNAYYVYFDQYTVSNSRSGYQNGRYSPTGGYRYDRWSRMGTTIYNDPYLANRFPMSSNYQTVPEYRYISAHFAKVAKTGQVLWDNAISYNEMVTNYPEAFGEVAVVGEDLYHMFVENETIRLSFFRNGERIFENQEFELGLVDKNERIRDTNEESLKLIHWYDRYYLLSGTQRVRFLNEAGTDETRGVYFLTKIVVDGDLYKPEGLPD
ncbi:transcriptional regulator [Algoriphagus sp. D3-2-R+10]|uniref:transcriptional regulator n=1 Tax=Algoriphagus aurantiacus TaxID=3103948 RepID=UPI002B3BF198|nr:transcriptional regulator [Algoriphagus sp. D3-2-R+10]MEB2776466.1 transcriptional regulator [Algoriphagus sp. D3-2-R+10]